MPDRDLCFSDFGVAVGPRAIIRDFSCRFPTRGLVRLLGPPGSGKSLIGRILARHIVPADVRFWGSITYNGLDWRVCPPAARLDYDPSFLTGTIRSQLLRRIPPDTLINLFEDRSDRANRTDSWVENFLAGYNIGNQDLDRETRDLCLGERRAWRLLQELASAPSLLFVDASEGDAWDSDLPAAEDARYHSILRLAAERALVVMAGRDEDQESPLKGLEVRLARPAADSPPPPRPPAWFQWVLWGRLAGMSRPGLLRPLREDIQSLKNLGVSTIVTLEEEPHHGEELGDAGFRNLHFPIVDMEAPTLDGAIRCVEELRKLMADGEAVVLHCKAGLGRTGTMLAALLTSDGYSAQQAITLLRELNPYYIQSASQLRFVERFAEAQVHS